MKRHPQFPLDLHEELIVDLFAGGGGASSGIEEATGRMVDIAINHSPVAVAMHQANHPLTKHLVCDVFEADPREVTGGRPVGLLWASPDCTYHSKARGAKPIRHKNKKRRALAWVVTRWAGQARPRVIMLENVEEFADWGPLVGPKDALRPCLRRRGRTFRTWVRSLERKGYVVECRELRACDYGAPTIRKRLFVIARRDGKPIVWPEPTHGPGRTFPYRTAAECIDWSIPMLSIFADDAEAQAFKELHGLRAKPKRPLAENSMNRIARGVKRFVIDAAKPFIVTLAHSSESPNGVKRRGQGVNDLDEPIGTLQCTNDKAVVAANLVAYHDEQGGNARAYPMEGPFATVDCANRIGVVASFLTPRYGERDGQEPRSRSIEEPSPTIVPTGNGANVVAAFMAQYNGGYSEGNSGDGHQLNESLSTIATKGPHQGVIAAHIDQANNGFENRSGRAIDEPNGAVCAHGSRQFLVASFLTKYFGTSIGSDLNEPADTMTAKDRFGVVTVTVDSVPYVIFDIAMRMLAPKELYACQGFRPDYIFDRTADGAPITKTEQVKMVGNSVCPPVAAALVRANVEELVIRRVA